MPQITRVRRVNITVQLSYAAIYWQLTTLLESMLRHRLLLVLSTFNEQSPKSIMNISLIVMYDRLMDAKKSTFNDAFTEEI